MYSEKEKWDREREAVLLKIQRMTRKAERKAAIERLPRLSQRIVGRFMEFFND
jgi:hypothetical protein